MTSRNLRILISGAGVAGLTAATWLGRQGVEPLVVEHAPDVRADGYIISLSHRSYQYAKQLDLLSVIEQRAAGIRASSYHRGANTLLKLNYERLFHGVDVLQIMRDDLQDLLYERASQVADFKFSTSIKELFEQENAVCVRFSDGSEREFDVVIGADGAHSNVRRLNFCPDAVDERHLGLCAAAFRLPNIADLRWKFETHMERDRYMVLFTTPHNGLAAVFVWASGLACAPPVEARAAVLRSAFRNSSELASRVLEYVPEDGMFYIDPLVQIRMNKWHTSRTVLIGDAAHCMTLISGQGATMAFTGACSLAERLLELPVEQAFLSYDADLRRTVHEVQERTCAASRWYVPRSVWRQCARDLAMYLFPTRVFERYFRDKYSRA